MATKRPVQAALPPRVCYVDTSVWVALLTREPTYRALANWLQREATVCCADWTQVELASALGIKYRRGELTLAQAQRVCAMFASMLVHQVREIAVEGHDVRQAALWCQAMDSGVRAGDALHLAVATRYRCSHFFSLDKPLNRQAELLGLQLIDPPAGSAATVPTP